MPQDLARRLETRAPIEVPPPRALVAVCLFGAALASAACAPLRPTRVPDAPAPSEATGRREPAASPSQRAPTSVEPSTAPPGANTTTPRVLVVKASAYNSHFGQTDSSPSVGAWGDRLVPGMKAIAVSKDLVELGLRRGQRVRIRGLPGEYVVLDRMPSRWHQKIDIYMGHDVRAARNWGVREVEIMWVPREEVEAEAD